MNGFKEFLMRGNVVDLAVAVVIGAAFGLVVTGLVNGVFNPIIGALFNAESLNDAFNVTIGPATLQFGLFISALINFVVVAFVVYFAFVLPVNRLRAFADRNKVEEAAAATSEDLLAEIRDLLKAQQK